MDDEESQKFHLPDKRFFASPRTPCGPELRQKHSVVSQKFLPFICHSGLDPESSVSKLDSRFRGNDGLGPNVKKC